MDRDLSIWKQLAAEFDPEALNGVLLTVREGFNLGYGRPLTMAFLNSKKNRAKLQGLIHSWRKVRFENPELLDASLGEIVAGVDL